jgi:hypothetical protein
MPVYPGARLTPFPHKKTNHQVQAAPDFPKINRQVQADTVLLDTVLLDVLRQK